ncbi:M23 family metallopeptidase [Streptomyces sp. NPDC051561]|uniref:M23 family metallopeptidase n=1 Tax=Streptomyces sp. NPDC051561 TaxID=3365658 RepID=UPI00378E19ED
MTARRGARHLMYVLAVYFVAQEIARFFVQLPYPGWAGGVPLWLAAALGLWRWDEARRRRLAQEVPDPIEVAPPVTGRWIALNSPGDRVPSHGTHKYAQTYAIDILAEHGEGAAKTRPAAVRFWPLARRSEAFPAFGAPLYAVADATVVHAEDRQRDHLSRNSLPGVLYLMVLEGAARVLGGPRRVVGNHLVLDLGDGAYAVYAHLRRGSLAVREGDRVTTGQQLARCGNSGNSSEPHLHFQLMDTPDLDTARGLPFTWHGIGVPRAGESFDVAPEDAPGVADGSAPGAINGIVSGGI